MCEEVYNSLLKALLAPNAGGVSWRPVRASAAGALSSLLQVPLVLPLLFRPFAFCKFMGTTPYH